MTGKELTNAIIAAATEPTKVNIEKRSSIIFTQYTDLELIDEFVIEEVLRVDFFNDFEGLCNLCNEVNHVLKKHTTFIAYRGMYPKTIFEEMDVKATNVIDKLYSGNFCGVCKDDYVVAYGLKDDCWKLYHIKEYNDIGFKLIK